jgi:hypothetical protein
MNLSELFLCVLNIESSSMNGFSFYSNDFFLTMLNYQDMLNYIIYQIIVFYIC